VPVLNGIDLAIQWRTMTGIVGPSGSGKSTLPYCLAGLERPSSGDVALLGRSIGHLPQRSLALR
jgi:putative ABC transport system ATP-binding protein